MKSRNIASIRLRNTIPRDRSDRQDIDTDSIKEEFASLAEEFFAVRKQTANLSVDKTSAGKILSFTVELD